MIGDIVVTIIWGVLFIIQSTIHHNERQDLYNRLMARDLGEYLTDYQPRKKPTSRQNYFKQSMSRAYRAMYGTDKAE